MNEGVYSNNQQFGKHQYLVSIGWKSVFDEGKKITLYTHPLIQGNVQLTLEQAFKREQQLERQIASKAERKKLLDSGWLQFNGFWAHPKLGEKYYEYREAVTTQSIQNLLPASKEEIALFQAQIEIKRLKAKLEQSESKVQNLEQKLRETENKKEQFSAVSFAKILRKAKERLDQYLEIEIRALESGYDNYEEDDYGPESE